MILRRIDPHTGRERSSVPHADRPSKPCVSCGREIQWRKKWERDWESVKFCSDACRRSKVSPLDLQLEASVLELLHRRTPEATICPSEVARAVGASTGQPWEPLMEPVRRAARRLAARNRVRITQGGREVDPSLARGPIRLKRGPAFGPVVDPGSLPARRDRD